MHQWCVFVGAPEVIKVWVVSVSAEERLSKHDQALAPVRQGMGLVWTEVCLTLGERNGKPQLARPGLGLVAGTEALPGGAKRRVSRGFEGRGARVSK